MEKVLFAELCERLDKTPEEILSMALYNGLPLWTVVHGPVEMEGRTVTLPEEGLPLRPNKEDILTRLLNYPETIQRLSCLQGYDADGGTVSLQRPLITPQPTPAEPHWLDGYGGPPARRYAPQPYREDFMVSTSNLYAYESDVLNFERTLKTSATPVENLLLPFMDPAHEFYSEELALAVEAWMKLYCDGGNYQANKAHKAQIEDQLPSDLSVSAIERICTVVNPQKKGGSPASGS